MIARAIRQTLDKSCTATTVLSFLDSLDERERRKSQANMVRHIIGNPFCPYPAPDNWPSSVFQLADALYQGENCTFALHDALLEADHPDLAEHFREEQWHPKGCWALDLLLGKK